MTKQIFISILYLAACLEAFPQTPQRDTIRISDFGLQPGTRENAVPYVQKALTACHELINPVILFQKGRYDFWPHHCIERNYYESNTTDLNPKRLAMLIEEMNGLTIDGNGSDFVFHDRIQPFSVDNSQNITIKNLTIDWDIPLTAQASIFSVTDEHIDISINVLESPYLIENDKLVFVGEGWKSRWWGAMEFEKETRIVTPQTGDVSCLGADWRNYSAEELSYGTVRLKYAFKRKPALGNWLVLRHSERDHAGVFIVDSKDVLVENLDMYHNAGLGILSQYSENLTFKNVRCVPNELKGRIFAGHDDGFHYSSCRGDIVVENCVFHALMDDPINVHGTSVRIMERVDDFTLICKFMHSQSVGMHWAQPDETVGFIDNKSMQTVATGIVKDFKKIDNELFEISFRQAVPNRIITGNALENLTWTSNVMIKDSYFKSCRARGILISTPGKVVIENNVFESSGSAILIAGDANFWYESGAVKDVLITKNIFKAPCMTAMYQFCESIISIFPEIPQPDVKTPFHRNIRIVGNEFHPFDYPVLYAISVENLFFSDNKLIRSRQFEPFHRRKAGLTFEFCKNVTITGNIIEGDVLGREIKLVETSKKEIKLDRNSFYLLSSSK